METEKRLQTFESILKKTSVEEIIDSLPKEVYIDGNITVIYHLHITYNDKWIVEYSKQKKPFGAFDTFDSIFDKPILECTHANLAYALLKLSDAFHSNAHIKEYDESHKQLDARLKRYKEVWDKYLNKK
jgi:hypothetical protein